MSDYDTYPAVDTARMFPPSVRAAIATAPEMDARFAHTDGVTGKLVIAGAEVGQPSPEAGLNTVGWVKAVFIPLEGTLPTPIDPYTIVIEMS